MEDLRFKNIMFKYDKGLIPRDTDLYYALSLVKELNETITKLTDLARVNKPAKENVPNGTKPGRTTKKRVGSGGSVRSSTSNSKDSTMEGGSKWVKAEEADQVPPQ